MKLAAAMDRRGHRLLKANPMMGIVIDPPILRGVSRWNVHWMIVRGIAERRWISGIAVRA